MFYHKPIIETDRQLQKDTNAYVIEGMLAIPTRLYTGDSPFSGAS